MRYRRHLVWSWGLLLCSAGGALADGVVRDSVGAISSGRGGTNIAHSDTGAILLDNPAGMVNIEGAGLFEFSADVLITDLDYSDPENSTNGKFRPVLLPEFSYIRKSVDGRWAAGIGAFVPAGFGGEWRLDNPILGRHTYKSFGALGKIIPGVAFQVTDQLSVGGSLGVGVSHTELEAPFFLQTGPLAGVPTLFDLQATGATPVWSVGLQYQLGERTWLGLSYVDESRFRLDGNVDARVFGLGPTPVSSEFDADVDLVWPRSVGLGVNHLLGDRHRLSADLLWFDWSHAFDQIDLKLTDSSNPLFTALVGPTIRDRFPLDWDDSISVRLGYECFLTPCDVFRAGYIFNSRTVPSSTLTPLIPGILEHAFTIGYGRRQGNWGVDLAYQFTFGPESHVDVSDVVGGDFNSSEIKAQIHLIFLTFSYWF